MDDHNDIHNTAVHGDDDDADTASQRSISLHSDSSPRHSIALDDDHNTPHNDHDDDDDRQSNNSPNLAHEFLSNIKHESHPYTLDTDFSSEAGDDDSLYMHENPYDAIMGSPVTSAAPSVYDSEPQKSVVSPSVAVAINTYPPTPIQQHDTGGSIMTPRAESITSFASNSTSYSRKARPESTLIHPRNTNTPLVLGIALVDFNHLVGPRIEFSQGEIFTDPEISATLPFLALPDGAHLAAEDYAYFHLVPSASPNPSTVFGISCNRQTASSTLLVKDKDVTRSTVQKAVVVLASEPVFGPIRDKLGVVTRALFEQRDFSQTDILLDFAASLEPALRSQLTESGLYMGTSLRELVHTFRQRTLVLLKALMLQRRIMFYGHPVERLCTYQYSLISLLPGLLQTLQDSGSPPLASRAPTLTKPNSLRTSDRKSMMAYLGLPLDIFGKDAFFQPYIPLQQLDMMRETRSWLCGSTNTIVTNQKEIDLLVNIETGTFEFRDSKLERSAGLTAADRKWMDDIVRDVNEGWDNDDPMKPTGLQFKGSDDYLRTKFEEYVSAALASVRYRDFVAKGEVNGVMITGGSGGDANSTEDFNPLWIAEFKKTNAFEVWDRTTDPMLFDIVEPRHPCNEKPSVVADIGLRLSEGIQELKLEQQLVTPTREALSRTFTAGAGGFFRAVEGVKGKFQQQLQRTPSSEDERGVSASGSLSSLSSTPVEVSPPLSAGSSADLGGSSTPKDRSSSSSSPSAAPAPAPTSGLGLLTSIKTRTSSISTPTSTSHRSPSVSFPSPSSFTRQHQSSVDLSAAALEAKATVGAWGVGIGSFLSTRASRFSMPKVGSVSGVGGVFGGNTKSTPDVVEQRQAERMDEVRSSLPPASLSRPSRVEEEPDVGQEDGVHSSLSAPPPPPLQPSKVEEDLTLHTSRPLANPLPQPSKAEEELTIHTSPPSARPRPQPSKVVEEPIETAFTTVAPASASAIATSTAPPALPSRVKAAIATVEARQPEPQIEQEQKPHDDLDRVIMMHDTRHKTDTKTKTNSPTLPLSGLSEFAEHEREHEGEEDLHDVYGEVSAVPGMAL